MFRGCCTAASWRAHQQQQQQNMNYISRESFSLFPVVAIFARAAWKIRRRRLCARGARVPHSIGCATKRKIIYTCFINTFFNLELINFFIIIQVKKGATTIINKHEQRKKKNNNTHTHDEREFHIHENKVNYFFITREREALSFLPFFLFSHLPLMLSPG